MSTKLLLYCSLRTDLLHAKAGVHNLLCLLLMLVLFKLFKAVHWFQLSEVTVGGQRSLSAWEKAFIDISGIWSTDPSGTCWRQVDYKELTRRKCWVFCFTYGCFYFSSKSCFSTEEIYLIRDNIVLVHEGCCSPDWSTLIFHSFKKRGKKKKDLACHFNAFWLIMFFACKALTQQPGYKITCLVCHSQMGPNVFLVQLY